MGGKKGKDKEKHANYKRGSGHPPIRYHPADGDGPPMEFYHEQRRGPPGPPFRGGPPGPPSRGGPPGPPSMYGRGPPPSEYDRGPPPPIMYDRGPPPPPQGPHSDIDPRRRSHHRQGPPLSRQQIPYDGQGPPRRHPYGEEFIPERPVVYTEVNRQRNKYRYPPEGEVHHHRETRRHPEGEFDDRYRYREDPRDAPPRYDDQIIPEQAQLLYNRGRREKRQVYGERPVGRYAEEEPRKNRLHRTRSMGQIDLDIDLPRPIRIRSASPPRGPRYDTHGERFNGYRHEDDYRPPSPVEDYERGNQRRFNTYEREVPSEQLNPDYDTYSIPRAHKVTSRYPLKNMTSGDLEDLQKKYKYKNKEKGARQKPTRDLRKDGNQEGNKVIKKVETYYDNGYRLNDQNLLEDEIDDIYAERINGVYRKWKS